MPDTIGFSTRETKPTSRLPAVQSTAAIVCRAWKLCVVSAGARKGEIAQRTVEKAVLSPPAAATTSNAGSVNAPLRYTSNTRLPGAEVPA
jgi:hypothetical protein